MFYDLLNLQSKITKNILMCVSKIVMKYVKELVRKTAMMVAL
jgi:hypothetical protein